MKLDDLDMDLQVMSKFFGSDYHYGVPHYQRNYAWQTDQVQQLLLDLENALDTYPGDVYLLGQVLLCPSSDREVGLDNDVYSFDLVDGQQRTTTMYLLFLLLRDSLEPDWVAKQNPGDQQKLSAWHSLRSLPNNHNHDVAIPRVRLASKDSRYWEHLLTQSPFPEAMTPTESNLQDARLAIEDFIESLRTNESRFNFLRFVMNQVAVITLVLPSSQHALRMFMKINNRGMKLDPSDIIKSYIFQTAHPEDYESLSSRWNEAQENLFTKARLSRIASMQFLMKALIGVKTGKSVRGDDLFDEWLEYLKTDGAKTSSAKVSQLAESLPLWADRLSQLSHRKIPTTRAETDLLRGTHEIKAVQHFEVLLGGAHLRQESFENLCRIVEDRMMLSSWSKEKNSLVETFIHPWAHATSALDAKASLESLLEAAEKAVRPTALEELFEIARAKIRRGMTYKVQSHHPRIRYFLARVNQEVQKRFSVNVPSIDELMKTRKTDEVGFDLDHIFPKARERREDWIQSTEIDKQLGASDRADDAINGIGNLTLLHSRDNNFNAASLPWDEAKIQSFTSSELVINRLLTPSGFKEVIKHGPHRKALHELGWPDGLSLAEWTEDSAEGLFNFYWNVLETAMRRNFGI